MEARQQIADTTIMPAKRSTKIATIGERSSGPIRSGSRRKIRRYGSETSRRKSRTAFSGREYGTRAPIENTNDATIHAMMMIV